MANPKSITSFIDIVEKYCNESKIINSFTELDSPDNIENVYGENNFRQFVLCNTGFDIENKRAYFVLIAIDKTTNDQKSYTQQENLTSIISLRNFCYSKEIDIDFNFESDVMFLTTEKSGLGIDWAIVEFSILIEIGTLKC